MSALLVPVLAVPALAQQETEAGPPAEQATPPAGRGPIQVETVRHVNSSLVLFDEHERRYVVEDGTYLSDGGVQLVIANGRIERLVGCGREPCDFTTHMTRVAGRQLFVYAELAVPDGTYRSDGGSWFRIEGGEIDEYFGAAE